MRPVLRRPRASISIVATVVAACGSSRSSDEPVDAAVPVEACTFDRILQPERCGCDFRLPVDLADAAIPFTAWPFGVHARTGHTEGHRGLDFQVAAAEGEVLEVEIVAPLDGTVLDIDNAQDQSGGLANEFDLSDPSVHFTKLGGDCGATVVFIPLRLDPGITAGTRVAKGRRLGALPSARYADRGRTIYSSHFEVDVRPVDDPAEYAVCPALLVDDASAKLVEDVVRGSTFDEKGERTVDLACEDGSTKSIHHPAEPAACNPRLPADLRDALAACQPSKAEMIW